VQHPRASMLVTNSYGKALRGPLSIYNFAGDLGKATFPAAVALMLPFASWRPVVGLTAAIGLGGAFALLFFLPEQPFVAAVEAEAEGEGQDGRGFNLLRAIGAFDTATRMGYLLFLPFLFEGKGGNGATLGLGLALLFGGGALGAAFRGRSLRQGGLRVAWAASRGCSERDRHGSSNRPVHSGDIDVAARTGSRPASASRRRSERNLLGALWDRSGNGAQGRDQPSIRAILHRCDRRRGISADRLWRDCGSFQQNDRHPCRGSNSSYHYSHGSCPGPFST
jgi:hypothetical protein